MEWAGQRQLRRPELQVEAAQALPALQPLAELTASWPPHPSLPHAPASWCATIRSSLQRRLLDASWFTHS